jgi:hypothetical protein
MHAFAFRPKGTSFPKVRRVGSLSAASLAVVHATNAAALNCISSDTSSCEETVRPTRTRKAKPRPNYEESTWGLSLKNDDFSSDKTDDAILFRRLNRIPYSIYRQILQKVKTVLFASFTSRYPRDAGRTMVPTFS